MNSNSSLLEEHWQTTLHRIEQDSIANPEKYNITDEEFLQKFFALKEKLDSMLYENK